MKRESLAFALAGVFFGVIVGWIVGTQQAAPAAGSTAVAAAPTSASSSIAPAPGASSAAPFDAARATELERQAASQPANGALKVELGNLYFDAQRFDQAIPWYEGALKLDPKNVNLSTDLAVAYYYTNQTDRALAQLDQSLKIDPRHVKTLLNQGIVRAFGKQDLNGATESWEKVVSIAPDSEEGRRAKQGLDGLRSAHANGSTPATAPGGGTK